MVTSVAGLAVWYHLLMATELLRLWPWLAVVAMGAGVVLVATRADGEEGRHGSPQVEPSPRAEAHREAKGLEGRSGTPVKVKALGRWVLIKAGSFTMGSPPNEEGARGEDEVQHPVTITRDFALQATEVTQEQWQEVMGNNPSFFYGCPDCPVERVTWFEAVAYSNALSKREGLPECYRLDGCTKRPGKGMVCASVSFDGLSCRGYRLPTEAEWEYAVRAGTRGSRYGDLDQIAWYLNTSDHTTHPVGQKRANRWGLFDMFGNVREWVHDWYGEFPAGPASDPVGPTSGSKRVRRGGHWYYFTGFLRAADRNGNVPHRPRASNGLRPARSLP